MKCTNWEVGSTWFAAEPAADYHESEYNPLDRYVTHGSYLSTCRSAIDCVLKNAGLTGTALIPAFTCHSVVQPFIDNGLNVVPYPINSNLTINLDTLRLLVEEHNPSAILVHGYFGLDTTSDARSLFEEFHGKGICIIEDMTQNMFSSFERIRSDYSLGSIRKWLPSPDGAFVSNIIVNGLRCDNELENAYLSAMLAKREYIVNGKGIKSEIMPLFGTAEGLLDSRTQPHAISNSTLQLLKQTNWTDFKQTRINNYNQLAKRLSRHSALKVIVKEASDREVPFMLPLLITQGRSEFQQYMAKHNVFPTVIWKCPDEFSQSIDPASKMIYDSILCFYIDQRYNSDDMAKVTDIVDSYFNKNEQ